MILTRIYSTSIATLVTLIMVSVAFFLDILLTTYAHRLSANIDAYYA